MFTLENGTEAQVALFLDGMRESILRELRRGTPIKLGVKAYTRPVFGCNMDGPPIDAIVIGGKYVITMGERE